MRKVLRDMWRTSWAGTKFLTRSRMLMITCSATETTLEPDTWSEQLRREWNIIPALDHTSKTWIRLSTAAFRSMWSDPTPAVMQILRFFAYQGKDTCKRSKSIGGSSSHLSGEAIPSEPSREWDIYSVSKDSQMALQRGVFFLIKRAHPGWKGVVMRTSAYRWSYFGRPIGRKKGCYSHLRCASGNRCQAPLCRLLPVIHPNWRLFDAKKHPSCTHFGGISSHHLLGRSEILTNELMTLVFEPGVKPKLVR